MDQPLVSVLVPVYHVEGYIERCARSVFEQTYSNLEFVFVNDATDDSSIDILNNVLNDYPEHYTTTVIIHHPYQKGLAAARNTAIAICNGEFVFHVDSDDWVETNAIELVVKKQIETNADIVSAEAYMFTKGIKSPYLTGGWNLDRETLLIGLLTYNVSTTVWRRLIRKNLYLANDVFCDERGSSGEDFQVLPRLVYYAKNVTGIKEYIYNYNKTNQYSYSNSADSDVNIQIQGLFSVQVIVSFFSNKEPLRKIVDGCDIKYIHSRMSRNASQKNKSGYKVFLEYMRNTDKSKWHMVHWDSFLRRGLDSNYYTLRLKTMGYRTLSNIKLLLQNSYNTIKTIIKNSGFRSLRAA